MVNALIDWRGEGPLEQRETAQMLDERVESISFRHAEQSRILLALCPKVAFMQVHDHAEVHLLRVSDTIEDLRLLTLEIFGVSQPKDAKRLKG